MDRSPSSRQLPTYAEEMLEALKPKIASTANGLPRAEAETYLDAEGFDESTIRLALDQLLNRGYIYVVNERIRLTDENL